VLEGYRQGVITATRAVELLHGVLAEDELPAVADPAA
jgi:hypothetical protein